MSSHIGSPSVPLRVSAIKGNVVDINGLSEHGRLAGHDVHEIVAETRNPPRRRSELKTGDQPAL